MMKTGPFTAKLNQLVEDWTSQHKTHRLWSRDSTLWTQSGEQNWLGWLDITQKSLSGVEKLEAFAQDVHDAGFEWVLVLGMGGSSLCPDVFARTMPQRPGFPKLLVLDSTDPAQIAHVEAQIDPAKTLFIVSSKSGTTLEPNIFMQYFLSKAPASQFVAVTDPGTPFEKTAREKGFRAIFPGLASIGGRYSALSNFGMVPAAAMGVDVRAFLTRAQNMVAACGPSVLPQDNPGVSLGLTLAALYRQGRDKITLLVSPKMRELGAWLEQLLAESTGKHGKGLIPIDKEPLGAPSLYGNDRLFVYIRLDSAPDDRQEQWVADVEALGHPLVRLHVSSVAELGAVFFQWEMATAVAGSVMGINPFDQPDVEASKIKTRELMSAYSKSGAFPEQVVYQAVDTSLLEQLRKQLSLIHPGDYVALLAYIQMSEASEAILQDMRTRVRDVKHNATCLGFGPRFLHSTGQAYKGGPNSGVFFQITCDDAHDIAIPGQPYSFGLVKEAQARGDADVLFERGRRVLRIRLGKDVLGDLDLLRAAWQQALS